MLSGKQNITATEPLIYKQRDVIYLPDICHERGPSVRVFGLYVD